jgi:hypothetical protein
MPESGLSRAASVVLVPVPMPVKMNFWLVIPSAICLQLILYSEKVGDVLPIV